VPLAGLLISIMLHPSRPPPGTWGLEQLWAGPRPAWPAQSWPSRPPLYIVGLPRTGTTMLHRLLAADPAGRPLRYWEASYPVRTPQRFGTPSAEGVRRAAAVTMINRVNGLAPYLKGIHEIDPLGPEECYLLLANTFISYGYPLQWDCAAYLEWLDTRTASDWTEVYRHYLATLRTLEGGRHDRHWVLKCPLHAAQVGVLRSLVPSAIYVQTYRDPREVVGSLCSLSAALMSLGSDRLDMKAIGLRALKHLSVQAQASLEACSQCPDDVVATHFKTLIRDPLSTVRAIYDRAGLPLSGEAVAAMNAWLARNPQGRHGPHRYSLTDFGLTERQVLDAFGDYLLVERSLDPALPKNR